MVASLGTDSVAFGTVADLPTLLEPGDVLVLNDTRVLPARFRARRSTGGLIEGLFLQTLGTGRWSVMLKSGGRLGAGETLELIHREPADRDGQDRLELVEKQAGGTWQVQVHSELDTEALLDRVGAMPLPPYIRRDSNPDRTIDDLDRHRYQTVFARSPGAVAAPTAGLHFTPDLLVALAERGVEVAWLTLHVGSGTFAPIRAERLEDHAMHSERCHVPAATLRLLAEAREQRRRIIPVGTTCVRAIESLPADVDVDRDHEASTNLLIQPGFDFRYTRGLMTNFHLPRSTLMALVAALTGLERLHELYRMAIRRRLRFYSYGDAMLIVPPSTS